MRGPLANKALLFKANKSQWYVKMVIRGHVGSCGQWLCVHAHAVSLSSQRAADDARAVVTVGVVGSWLQLRLVCRSWRGRLFPPALHGLFGIPLQRLHASPLQRFRFHGLVSSTVRPCAWAGFQPLCPSVGCPMHSTLLAVLMCSHGLYSTLTSPPDFFQLMECP